MKIPYKALLFAPYVLFVLGMALNAVATLTNGQQMPVLFPGGDCSLLGDHDVLHVCMTHASHFKFLSDVFLSHDGVASIGDLLQDIADVLQWPMLGAWCLLVLRRGE